MRFKFRSFIFLLLSVLVSAGVAGAQEEIYTGTIVSYGNGIAARTRTGTFTLRINKLTSDQRANELLGLLQEGSDETLLNKLDNEDVGSFSVDGNIGPRINVVRESMVDGKKRIIAVFRRWMNFGELRGGYRSTDYPYGYIELYIDPQTGKGSGTYFAAADIDWKRNKKTNQNVVEIENFATFPAQLLGVTRRGEGR